METIKRYNDSKKNYHYAVIDPEEIGKYRFNLLKGLADKSPEFVGMLLEKGFPIDLTDNNKMTLLYSAVMRDNVELAKFLIEKGASVEMQDAKGKRPVDYAKSDAMKELF